MHYKDKQYKISKDILCDGYPLFQNFLVTMSISTNGKILLQDEISTFAKFIDIEVITYVIVPTVYCDNISNSLFFFLKNQQSKI